MAPHLSMHTGPCSWCVKLAKWLPVIFIVSIVTWSYYAYVIQLNISAYLLVYHALLVMFIWSYWQTIFTKIGMVPKQFRLPPADVEAYECAPTEEQRRIVLERFTSKQGLPVVNRTMTGDIRYCEKCCHIKPDRCHHCSVCGECVLKMDHHCPWVNNCVSFSNYKFFVLFLCYAFIYCIFVASTTFEYLIKFWQSELQGAGKFHILFVFFVAIMFAISLISLLGYHIFLIVKNRSTIESFRGPIFYINHSWLQDKEGFSLGAYNNFLEVFGDCKKHWFLPIFTSIGDGVSYPMRLERLELQQQQQQQTPTDSYSSNNILSTDAPSTITNTTAAAAQQDYDHQTNHHHCHQTGNHQQLSSNPSTECSSPPSYGSMNTSSLGDGVSYPQRCVEEDMDGLLNSDATMWENHLSHYHNYSQRGQQYLPASNENVLEEVVVHNNHHSEPL